MKHAILFLVLFLFFSCSNDNPVDPEPQVQQPKDYFEIKKGDTVKVADVGDESFYISYRGYNTHYAVIFFTGLVQGKLDNLAAFPIKGIEDKSLLITHHLQFGRYLFKCDVTEITSEKFCIKVIERVL